MSKDEEFVRANWAKVDIAWGDCGPCSVILFRTRDGHNTFNSDDAVSSLSAAAEFTRERREQIRQLEREILIQHNLRDMYARETMDCITGTCSILGRDLEGTWAMCAYTVGRTILRLESALADLKRGMKSNNGLEGK